VNFKSSILRYWLAMNATAFDSAVNAVVIYGGTASAHQAATELGWNVAALTLQQFAIVFLSAFAWGLLQYLHAHPVTALLPPLPVVAVPIGPEPEPLSQPSTPNPQPK
jgi:hypothetical protein